MVAAEHERSAAAVEREVLEALYRKPGTVEAAIRPRGKLDAAKSGHPVGPPDAAAVPMAAHAASALRRSS